MELHWRRLGFIQFQSTPSTRRVTIQPLFVPPIKIISIHTLHTEGDRCMLFGLREIKTFQSTPSTRRVTVFPVPPFDTLTISIHTLHTEGDGLDVVVPDPAHISIHTLHTEGDRPAATTASPTPRFQSTPSTRRVTADALIAAVGVAISIHTLHTEGDPCAPRRTRRG